MLYCTLTKHASLLEATEGKRPGSQAPLTLTLHSALEAEAKLFRLCSRRRQPPGRQPASQPLPPRYLLPHHQRCLPQARRPQQPSSQSTLR
jgi:hypothetical protein